MNEPNDTLTFGDTVVSIEPWGSVITWPDGSSVIGMPEDTDEYRATAINHGYDDDTLALCQEHELMHVALCHWLGTVSPVMEEMRTPGMAGSEIRRYEEAAVLAIQSFARAMDVDLIAAMRRHASSQTSKKDHDG